MKRMPLVLLVLTGFLILGWSPGQAKDVQPMFGGTLVTGYDFANDRGPKGSVSYDVEQNQFKGSYTGLKMPEGRRAIFAWLHDTVNQKTAYLGPVGWLQMQTGGKTKGRFTIPVPETFKGGNFGSYEIIAFSAEKTGFLDGDKVVQKPAKPAGSDPLPFPNPAFYLFAALPGADTQVHYCGHGQDFFFANPQGLAKQDCYDCICGQKYATCKQAGLASH